MLRVTSLLALFSLERALSLAEPEGYVRIFVVEGEPMRKLIADYRFSIEDQKSEVFMPITVISANSWQVLRHPIPNNQLLKIQNQKWLSR